MFNAKKAKETTDQNIESAAAIELRNLEMKITEAIRLGKYSFTTGDLSYKVKQMLESLGYKVSYYSDQREGESYTTIDWS